MAAKKNDGKDKPGYRTTEFWLSTAVCVFGAVLAAGLPDDHIVIRVAGAAVTVLGALGYDACRSKVKSGNGE